MQLIERKEIPCLRWLSEVTKLDERLLGSVLQARRSGEVLYSKVYIPKSSGGVRTISIPDPFLRKVQRAINKNVLSDFTVSHYASGFSGGSIVDVIKPHLKSRVMLSLDIVEAFDHVTYEVVLNSLTCGRVVRHMEKGIELDSYGLLSWRAARVVTDLCTWCGKLPQGAPTSPRLFDQSFMWTDEKLEAFASRIGGVYTRYADNIYFSLKRGNRFPPKLVRAVLRIVEKRHKYHKCSARNMKYGVVKMLGLNVAKGKINVPREYKRNLRLAVHHVGYLLDHNMPYENALLKLRGQMSFGSLGALPDSLLNTYANLEERIEEYEA